MNTFIHHPYALGCHKPENRALFLPKGYPTIYHPQVSSSSREECSSAVIDGKPTVMYAAKWSVEHRVFGNQFHLKGGGKHYFSQKKCSLDL